MRGSTFSRSSECASKQADMRAQSLRVPTLIYQSHWWIPQLVTLRQNTKAQKSGDRLIN